MALGAGRTAVAISAGKFHACAILDNATVKCWGWNVNGQLGQGDTANRGDGANEMGDNLPAVALGTGRTAVAISAGAVHDCALLDNATVKCWGANFSGQLGRGDTANRGDNPNEMGDNLLPVDLGTGRSAVAVTTGNGHSCARLDDGSLKCWGDGSAVGQGNNSNALGDEPGEMGDALPVVSLVTPAPAMSVVLASDESSVAVGATIHSHATITNTGNVGLTGLTVSTAGCGTPPGVLLPGDHTVVDCTHVATARDVSTYAASVSADSDQTTAVTSNTVNVTVTIPSGHGLVAGQVTARIFGNAVSGVLVAALDKDTFAVVGLDTTAVDGTYAMLVPAGGVFFYLADPAGGHIATFAQNSPTTIADGQTLTLNPQLNRALGGIEGRITDEGSGTGLTNGLALTTNALTGQMSIGASTDGFGFYVIRNLRSVGYWVALLDLSGGHAPRYYNGATSPAGATTVNVVGGALQVIGTSTLPAQTPPGGAAHLQGTVTGAGGAALSGVAAIALRAGTFEYVGGDLTDGSGTYDIAVDAGSYIVGFADPGGSHLFEWYADQPGSGLATATPVATSAGSPDVADASLGTLYGSLSGTVTEDGSGNPLQDMWVFAIDSTGSVVGVAKTAANGTYTISNVPAGGIRVRILDITGNHVPEYYDDHAGPNAGTDYPSATIVPITGGATTTVSAGLALSS